MKKVLALVLSLMLIFCCGCNESTEKVSDAKQDVEQSAPKTSDIGIDEINGLWECDNSNSGDHSASVYINAPKVYLRFWSKEAPTAAEVEQEAYLIAEDLEFEGYNATTKLVSTHEHQCWNSDQMAFSVMRYISYNILGDLHMKVASGGGQDDPHAGMEFYKK